MKKPLTHEQKEKRRLLDQKRNADPVRKAAKDIWQRKWESANPEKMAAIGAKRQKTQRNKDWQRNHLLKKKFGITLERYRQMHAEQGGLCAICMMPPGKKALAVDHCHETGKVRALLCGKCNPMLGLAKESPLVFMAAIAYLQGYK